MNNPLCKKCRNRDLEPIFGTGRSLWCPDCDSHSKKIKDADEWIQGDGFKMKEMNSKERELIKFGSDQDPDEITQPMDPIPTKKYKRYTII